MNSIERMDPMTPDEHGNFVNHERDLKGWRINSCVEHEYEGVPPCPHIDCYRGKRDVYRTMKVMKATRLSDSDEFEFGYERIFIREATHPKPNQIKHVWREVAFA